MKITEKRDMDIRVGFYEGEYAVIDDAVDLLGFSNRAGFLRFHINKALRETRNEVLEMSEMTGRPVRCSRHAPQRAGHHGTGVSIASRSAINK